MVHEVKRLRPGDTDQLTDLIRVFELEFEMENFSLPRPGHLARLLKSDRFMAFVALKNHLVIGGLTAYVLDQYYSEKPIAYVYDLAVLSDHQRQGIASSLMSSLNELCRHEGFEEVYVQADKTDNHALEFYRSTQPGQEEAVVQFSYFLGGD